MKVENPLSIIEIFKSYRAIVVGLLGRFRMPAYRWDIKEPAAKKKKRADESGSKAFKGMGELARTTNHRSVVGYLSRCAFGRQIFGHSGMATPASW